MTKIRPTWLFIYGMVGVSSIVTGTLVAMNFPDAHAQDHGGSCKGRVEFNEVTKPGGTSNKASAADFSDKNMEGSWISFNGMYPRCLRLSPNHTTSSMALTAPNCIGPPEDTDEWKLQGSTLNIDVGVVVSHPGARHPKNGFGVSAAQMKKVQRVPHQRSTFSVKNFHGYPVLTDGENVYTEQFPIAPHEVLFGLWREPTPKGINAFWAAHHQNMLDTTKAFKKRKMDVCFIHWTFLFQEKPEYYVRDQDFMKVAYPAAFWQKLYQALEKEKAGSSVNQKDCEADMHLSDEQIEKVVNELIASGNVNRDPDKRPKRVSQVR